MIEMTTCEGTCKYCGEIVPILAADEKDADNKVTKNCDCGGAKNADKLKKAKKALFEICNTKEFQEVDPDTIKMLEQCICLIIGDKVAKVTFLLDDSSIIVSKNTKSLKLTRKRIEQKNMEV